MRHGVWTVSYIVTFVTVCMHDVFRICCVLCFVFMFMFMFVDMNYCLLQFWRMETENTIPER